MVLATLTQCETRWQAMLALFDERYKKLKAGHPDVKKKMDSVSFYSSNRAACSKFTRSEWIWRQVETTSGQTALTHTTSEQHTKKEH
jgi:hypothetical protein